MSPNDSEAFSDHDKTRFAWAYTLASRAHKGQKRKSGNPFFLHPLRVSTTLMQTFQDVDLGIAALLHDTVEDCPEIDMETIYRNFGRRVGFIVDAVTKDRKHFHRKPSRLFDSKIDRLLWAGMKDVRVLILKLADRSDNLATLEKLPEDRQVRMAFETQAIFEPLKEILGYPDVQSLKEARKRLGTYLKANRIKDAKGLKEKLIGQTFENIDSHLFGLFYKGTDSIIWRISDYDTYVRITNSPELCQKLEILSVEGNQGYFLALFRFKNGALIRDVKLTPSHYASQPIQHF